jgi:phosphoribosylaminoimidazole (AIR) synthetase
VVEREKIITGKDVQIGDTYSGPALEWLHTNGHSLARKLLFEVAHHSADTYVNEVKNKVGNELMRTHKATGRRCRSTPMRFGAGAYHRRGILENLRGYCHAGRRR